MQLKNSFRTGLLLTTALLSACETEAPAPLADIILTNGYVYTVDQTRSVREAIAIGDGHIIAVGDNETVLKHAGPQTQIRDLHGKMVMPGLHDMHIHALGVVKPDLCDLDSTVVSLDEMVPLISACLEQYPPGDGGWLPVVQWNPFEGNQPSAKYPTLRAALDAVSIDHPIIMWGDDGHHGAANSAALNSPTTPINANSLKTTYKDFQKLIAVDETGAPSGGLTEGARNILRKDMHGDMLGSSTPPENLMPRVAAKLAASGITSIQDAAVGENELAQYRWLDQSGKMTFRVRTALHVSIPNGNRKEAEVLRSLPDIIDQLKKMRATVEGSHYIRAEAVKLFADGVLEGNPHAHPPTLPNAAMIDSFHLPLYATDEKTGGLTVTGYVDPQSDECKTGKTEYLPSQCVKSYGILENSESVLKEFVRLAIDAGFHVHIHAIADRAVRVTADAFEATKEAADRKGLTQSIAHLQIGKTEDLIRHGKLNTFVVFTYVWATPEPAYEMTLIPFIDKVDGTDLYNPDHYYMKNAYPVKSIQNYGAVPVFGSDAPVSSRDPRPFASMQAAMTRASNGITLNPAQRLDIHETIASYTINSARLMKRDHELGSLEAGKIADIIILNQNIAEIDPARISKTKVLTTIFEGRIVHDISG